MCLIGFFLQMRCFIKDLFYVLIFFLEAGFSSHFRLGMDINVKATPET